MSGIEERTGRWQKILYVVNLITFALGVAMIGVAVHYLRSDVQQIVVPTWAVKLLLAFGVIVALISLMGCWGAYKAPDRLTNKQHNIALIIYFIIVFISLVLQFVGAAVLLAFKGVLDDAKKNEATSDVQKLDTDVQKFLMDHPSEWIDVQNSLGCCGYNMTTGPLATGDVCNTSNPEANLTCRTDLLNKAEDQAVALSALAIVFGIMQILAFISAYMLLCCVTAGTSD